jgi:hypothetical protein
LPVSRRTSNLTCPATQSGLSEPPTRIVVAVAPDAKGVETGEGRRAP